MKFRIVLAAALAVALAAVPTTASKVDRLDLESTDIVVGEVASVSGFFGETVAGEGIIFSRVTLRVAERLKGKAGAVVEFDVEGGEVGNLGLRVSDAPEFRRGERVKAYLKKGPSGYELLEKGEAGRKAKPPKPSPGQCCSTFAHWQIASVPYLLNTVNNDGNGDAAVKTAVQSGLSAWPVSWRLEGGTTTTRVAQNGLNEIFFAPESKGSAIAVTYTWYNTSTKLISEFDMKFYDKAWLFFVSNCQGGFYIKTITTHESGHAIGLNHNSCTDSIMYPYASYCQSNTVSAADRACAQTLY